MLGPSHFGFRQVGPGTLKGLTEGNKRKFVVRYNFKFTQEILPQEA